MSCEPAACFHHRHFIAKDIDGFVEQDIFSVFLRFFGCQFIGQFAFARLQAIVPERGALLRRALLANNVIADVVFHGT